MYVNYLQKQTDLDYSH